MNRSHLKQFKYNQELTNWDAFKILLVIVLALWKLVEVGVWIIENVK
jgi:hypothetical protein